MTQAFNCTEARDWEKAPGTSNNEDNELLYESSSNDGDPDVFYASDADCRDHESEMFYSSDEEGPLPAEPSQKRARYNPRRQDPVLFLGKPVCRRALSSLIAIGGSTLQKLRAGESAYTNNVRKPLQKHPQFGFSLRGDTGMVWEEIVMFFFHLYHSAAEVMPTNWHSIKEAGSQAFETPFPEDDADGVDKSEDLQRLVNAIGRTLNTYLTDVDCQLIGPGTFRGPRRCLQHGCRTDLYWEYVAYAEFRGIKPASLSTFMKVANTIIKPGLRDGHLKFRKAGDHAQCDACFSIRERIRAARTPDAKLAEERELIRHRLSQWQDRQAYWSFRSMSQTFFSQLLASDGRSL